ncbi:hypothetical protein [Tellurirhabdus bombi]|uniref:hypothetical protein n=1 Tax=Tellurirhabdus bombi TaxID=2907205 RepID=UPI001F1FAD92|nr:hypothetical protein [Tellurirhabdus bombi]
MNTMLKAIASGFAGACALTLLHETARRFIPEAPRADILGMRAIAKGLRAADQEPPADPELHTLALGGDILSNSIYYSLIGVSQGKGVPVLGAALGALAGVGAVTLPGPMGLGTAPSSRTPATAAMTVGWYLFGGLVAAAAYEFLDKQLED